MQTRPICFLQFFLNQKAIIGDSFQVIMRTDIQTYLYQMHYNACVRNNKRGFRQTHLTENNTYLAPTSRVVIMYWLDIIIITLFVESAFKSLAC